MNDTDCGLHTLVADVAVRCDGDVLLVRYAESNRYDHQRGWFLPDDRVLHLEHPESAVGRILTEQVGLSAAPVSLGSVESFRGNDRTWHLVFHYIADLPERSALALSADVAAAEWFPLDALPERGEVAHHGWTLDVLLGLFGVSRFLSRPAGAVAAG
ncbi:MAG: NUDIX hydrolase [Dehalococcoidia bacterium]